MTASYNNLASRVEVKVIFTTTFKNSTYLSSISNLNPPSNLPVFTLQPQSQTVDEYATATFTAAADNATSYQWSKNAANVGADSTSYAFATTAADNGAVINVTATGTGGVVVSNNATLSVTSYVFNFDGVTQSAVLSNIISMPKPNDFELEIRFSMPASINSNQAILGSTVTSGASDDISQFSMFTYAAGLTAQLPATGSLRYRGFSGSVLFGQENIAIYKSVGNSQTFILNGTSSSSSYTNLVGISIAYLARHASSLRVAGKVSGFKLWAGGDRVGGVLVNHIPLNNKPAGALQPALVGPITATIENYNVSGWVVK